MQKNKIVLGVEYDGSNYHGWQRQRKQNLVFVQEVLEKALSKVANQPIEVICAGRTDAGVHALGQVVHFETDAERDVKAWVRGTNTYLPDDVRVIWSKAMPADSDFHARFSATERHYRYYIYNSDVQSAILHNKVSFYPQKLDVRAMQKGAKYLLGKQDFSSFRASGCQANSPIRNVKKLTVRRDKKYQNIIVIDIVANAFLHHMVRNIVGTLLMVGKGEQKPKWIKEILDARDRKVAGPTAQAAGLYLLDVCYPRKFELPTRPNIYL